MNWRDLERHVYVHFKINGARMTILERVNDDWSQHDLLQDEQHRQSIRRSRRSMMGVVS